MLVGFTKQDYQNWSASMHAYEKEKRTKKPFGKQFQNTAAIVNSAEIREHERSFNPVLQTYHDPNKQREAQVVLDRKQQQLAAKQQSYLGRSRTRDYDIISLYGSNPEDAQPTNQCPLRSVYNPITNSPLPAYYLKNREIRVNREKEFKNIKPKDRDFNIVTGIYNQDNQAKQEHMLEYQHQLMETKLKNRDYDPVIGRYYDDDKERNFQEEAVKQQNEHSLGTIFNKRLPPSYLSREPVNLNRDKPLSQSVIELDRKKQNTKLRYKLKYLIQKQYQQRNLDNQQKQEQLQKNRIYNSHSIIQKVKQLDTTQLSQIKAQLHSQIFAVDHNKYAPKKQAIYPSHHHYDNKIRYSNTKGIQSRSNSSLYSDSQVGSRSNIKSGGFL